MPKKPGGSPAYPSRGRQVGSPAGRAQAKKVIARKKRPASGGRKK